LNCVWHIASPLPDRSCWPWDRSFWRNCAGHFQPKIKGLRVVTIAVACVIAVFFFVSQYVSKSDATVLVVHRRRRRVAVAVAVAVAIAVAVAVAIVIAVAITIAVAVAVAVAITIAVAVAVAVAIV
jgi:hypothetical protein